MTISSGLAMSWQEWRNHDAVGLAELGRARQAELERWVPRFPPLAKGLALT
jgi:hypothetical protein